MTVGTNYSNDVNSFAYIIREPLEEIDTKEIEQEEQPIKYGAEESEDITDIGYDTDYSEEITNTSTLYNENNDNKCTDGNDDGKIGFWGVTANLIEGGGKAIKNGVKSLFTNKDGKFSVGKTLFSLAAGALCFAVPGVGLAACIAGGIMGIGQIAKGAKMAKNATTDAQAKQAWENIGGGILTTAVSAAPIRGRTVASLPIATGNISTIEKKLAENA